MSQDGGANAALSNQTTSMNPDAGHLIVINTYQVEPAHAEELLESLVRSTREVLRFIPGFVSANLHVSKDRTQLVNYAQWRDQASLEGAGKDSAVQERIREVAKVAKSFMPTPYDLRICLHGVEASTDSVAPKQASS